MTCGALSQSTPEIRSSSLAGLHWPAGLDHFEDCMTVASGRSGVSALYARKMEVIIIIDLYFLSQIGEHSHYILCQEVNHA